MSNPKPKMTKEQWLSNVSYDKFGGMYLWNKEPDGGSQMVAEVRGWGALHHYFDTPEEATKFQNEVGEFIAEAIREKIERQKTQGDVKKI